MGDVILGSVDWVCFDGLFGAGEGPQSRDFLHLAQNPQIVVPRIWGLLKSTDCGSSRLGGGPPFFLGGGGGPDAPTPVVTSLPGVAGP